MATAMLKICMVALLGLAAADERAAATPDASAQSLRTIGYLDAKAQQELPLEALPSDGELSHLVLTGALTVDNNGTIHLRPAAAEGELGAEELIGRLAARQPKLVLSLRGHPDDVALDELAEQDEVRARFATEMALLLRRWGADGLEIEWHSDDPNGGKAATAPFDAMEQYHFALLCRDLAGALRATGGNRTLSVAARPGRKEFADGNFVRAYIDWLALRAYSMRSLGDPHHSSLKDMHAALDEWTDKGVPRSQLVLGLPLFARPGAALHSAGDRNEALRRSWRDIVGEGMRSPGGDHLGDAFIEPATGKVWWASGATTTKAKVDHVAGGGYGGIAFRDLHHDVMRPVANSSPKTISLVQVATEAVKEHRRKAAKAKRRVVTVPHQQPWSLMQKGLIRSKTDPGSLGDERRREL